MCTISNTAATVVQAIPPSDRDPAQPSQAGTNSGLLCRGARKTLLPMGSRGTPYSPSRLCLPFFRWPSDISIRDQPHCLRYNSRMCRGQRAFLLADHLHTIDIPRQPILYPTFQSSLVIQCRNTKPFHQAALPCCPILCSTPPHRNDPIPHVHFPAGLLP